MMRAMFASAAALALVGATVPETRFTVTLPSAIAEDAGGRLLLFAEPATPDDANTDVVDVGDPNRHVSVAARDLPVFGKNRTATIDAEEAAFPQGFAALPPGLYHVQAVLDRDGSYNYGGRGPGDLISKVVTVRLPLVSAPTIVFAAIDGPLSIANFELVAWTTNSSQL